MRLILYLGKGGVGKTTTAAATAVRAAELGKRTLVVIDRCCALAGRRAEYAARSTAHPGRSQSVGPGDQRA